MSLNAFIKLFKTPRSHYVFDVNKNALLNVSEAAYKYFDQGEKAEDLTSDAAAEIELLRKRGYLSAHRVSKVEHQETNHIPALIKTGLSEMVLQVTQACNLCCIYCPYANSIDGSLQRSHSNKVMSFATARKAIDLLSSCSEDSDSITIGFYGGEPLIAFPLIKECVKYAKEVFEGKQLFFIMTSNVTLCNDEIIDFLVENNFIITVSMDGPQEIHDKNRIKPNKEGTYQVVEKNLNRMVERWGDACKEHISINVVVNPADDLDIIDNWTQTPLIKNVIFSSGTIENDELERKFEDYENYDEKYQYKLALAMLDYLQIVPNLTVSRLVTSELNRLKDTYKNFKQGESVYNGPRDPDHS